ncbi:MAG: hypothetical protein JSS24_13130 [Proteobacteria bacterium]|nr:hypothetical protein [Pseudomonadota bacterium]
MKCLVGLGTPVRVFLFGERRHDLFDQRQRDFAVKRPAFAGGIWTGKRFAPAWPNGRR